MVLDDGALGSCRVHTARPQLVLYYRQRRQICRPSLAMRTHHAPSLKRVPRTFFGCLAIAISPCWLPVIGTDGSSTAHGFSVE